MLRPVLIILVVATVIGAMMPSNPARPSSESKTQLLSTSGTDPEPEPEPSGADGNLTLERRSDGHFYADARVNGTTIEFLVDTGASGVALAQSDARRAGVAYSPGSFEVIGEGASGDVRGQPVLLERISLGHKEATSLPAVILEGSEQSLLGQNFLRQFDSVAIEGDRMVLR